MKPNTNIARIKSKAVTAGIAGAVAIVLAAWFFAHLTRSFFVEAEGKNLIRVASSLARQINAGDHAAIRSPADMSTPTYDKITKIIESFQNENPDVFSAYTMRVSGDNATLIVSPPADLNRDGVISGELEQRDAAGTPYIAAPDKAMRKAASGQSWADSSFTADRWGIWLTACAPLKTSTALIDGIVCVDEDSKLVNADMFKLNAMIVGMAVVCALLLCGLLVEYVLMKAELASRGIIESERETSLAHFVSAIENLAVIAVQSFDREGVINTWNSVSEKIYGIPSSAATGNDITAIFSNKDEALALKKTINEVFASGQASPPHERTVTTRSGEARLLRSTMFPMIEGGEVSEVFCMDVDVTERK